MCARPLCAVVAILLVIPALLPGATPVPIGFASNESDFAVGSSRVQNHATIFDGDAIRSMYFATRLNLKDGSRYVLGIGSEATIHRDGLVLRSGSAQVVNAGRTSRVLAGPVSVTAAELPSTATVYLVGKDRVTVLVRNGAAKVDRATGASLATLRAGEAASWKSGTRGALERDSNGALREILTAQSEQIASLNDSAKDMNCLAPRVGALSKSFAGLASQFASNIAARNAIQTRVDAGRATPTDLRYLTALNADMTNLLRRSSTLASDITDVVFLHHVPPAHSTHTVHGHTLGSPHEHHGEHGHTVPFGGGGHHNVPPHQST